MPVSPLQETTRDLCLVRPHPAQEHLPCWLKAPWSVQLLSPSLLWCLSSLGGEGLSPDDQWGSTGIPAALAQGSTEHSMENSMEHSTELSTGHSMEHSMEHSTEHSTKLSTELSCALQWSASPLSCPVAFCTLVGRGGKFIYDLSAFSWNRIPFCQRSGLRQGWMAQRMVPIKADNLPWR